jgi:dTDP-4-amino-4,6-dideoxygalactose transaminase
VHAHYCLVAVLEDRVAPRRSAIIDAMKNRGVGTSVYYPVPVPLSTYYREKYQPAAGAFPQASRIGLQSIALPVGPHLDEHDMHIIADTLKQAILEARS